MKTFLQPFLVFCAAAAVSAGLSGCALLGVGAQTRAIAENGFVAVQIENYPPGKAVYVVAMSGTDKVLGTESLGPDGVATFILPVGCQYAIKAFADANSNRKYDRGELAGALVAVSPVPLGDATHKTVLHHLRLGANPPAGLKDLAVSNCSGSAVNVGFGSVAKLSDPRFSPARGEAGMWTPQSALETGLLGLYLIHPDDPSKIPVVFVHGIGGSPQDFTKLIPALDQTKFQPWFFTYPSGYRLDKVSSAFASILEYVAKRHGVTRVEMVAHSMGGLVARSTILKMAAKKSDVHIGHFLSISTPWNGHEAARRGVRYLRHPVPSWIDMVPGSPFLKSLWSQKLPTGTRHWLIFGYDTKRIPWLTLNNDRVINLRSALFVPAQEEAIRVFGLEKSHEGILNDPATAAKMNEYLSVP